MAYSVEGGHSKLCPNIKKMCLQNPAFAHSILEKYTDALCVYASYQVSKSVSQSVSHEQARLYLLCEFAYYG